MLFVRYYDKFKALVVAEVTGSILLMSIVVILYRLLKSGDRSIKLAALTPGIPVMGMLVIAVLFGISFAGSGTKGESKPDSGAAESGRPNVLLIVMDTVRADHLSLYGYHRKTTPFLEKFAEESVVFSNAVAPAPWTLPSHASLFTGLYPSQHNTHGEHFWLDSSFRTLAEMLHDNGYQTISFSNNDYITPYHNMVQGFERTWFKGSWTDEPTLPPHSSGGSIVAFFDWAVKVIRTEILAKVIKNPASIWDYPKAETTNKAVMEWLNNEREDSRPFFIFINYMDAHFPYDPDDRTASLFLDEEKLKSSYSLKLRFPPVEHMIDMAKGGYTESDVRIMTSLYDACIRYLDGELEKLYENMKKSGLNDKTLIIITSDHGEYLGTRNRLGHGLGLHEEVLHVPMIARFPGLFRVGSHVNHIVSLIDIPETILSFANIKERPKGIPDTQRMFDLREDPGRYVFAESRFPLNLLIGASLLDDNSALFVEQKTIRSLTGQFIWKSRGPYEFYDVAMDPAEEHDVYSPNNRRAEEMNRELVRWRDSLYISERKQQDVKILKEDNHELIDKLKAVGYIN
jgi:arylsulfatase A-like enzyme